MECYGLGSIGFLWWAGKVLGGSVDVFFYIEYFLCNISVILVFIFGF